MTENPLYLKDIEIISNKNEAPSVKINSKVNSQILKEYNIHISLSHTKKYATGIAIIEKITSISK